MVDDHLPIEVETSERISRFIYSSRNFTVSTNRVRPAAFELPPNQKNISAYRTIQCSEEKIWYLADTYAARNGILPKARVDLEASAYREVGLDFDPNGEPHKRHTNIVGWPDDEVRQKEITVDLAKHINRILICRN